jgi:hypothetical protein
VRRRGDLSPNAIRAPASSGNRVSPRSGLFRSDRVDHNRGEMPIIEHGGGAAASSAVITTGAWAIPLAWAPSTCAGRRPEPASHAATAERAAEQDVLAADAQKQRQKKRTITIYSPK